MIATQGFVTQTIGIMHATKKRISRVLLVEDCLTQAYLLQNILQSEELEVELAVDGEQGLLLFETKEFDLVITDIGLPGMSGIDLCKQIKNHSSKSDIPVVLLTSLGDPLN